MLTRQEGCGSNRRHRSHARSLRLFRSGLSCVRECVQCARALCYYILSVVPDAGAGPCHWLLLVSYSGAMYFWSTSRAPNCCTSFSLEKKEGLRKGREAEFVTGDTAKKAACHGYVKKRVCILRSLLQRSVPLSLACHEIITCRTVISSYRISVSYRQYQ